MPLELKITLLIAIGFIFVCFIALMTVMRSVGNINHAIDRIEDIVSKEVILNFNKHLLDMKQEKQRIIARVEKKRRQDALLNIPFSEEEL